ncbi:NMT1/THI5-like protein [Bifidobacterium lemurum]|uniref:NMT1/THI5-like protein n=1 Tax=Bifidobacterium lemurum TaxID=1603886 RepID=A0A261FNV1_9BIFI|nr:ABC transporter substrate-binding protein [Bifidobacterium lemurum]OZG60665.1 NMT1/THI5-like protein [Bifidobacterium lemurum]QOL34816.1 ABC transporter substrate-binding protein [Bifidobacterium lemurum]
MNRNMVRKTVAVAATVMLAVAGTMTLAGCSTGEPDHSSAADNPDSTTIRVATQRQPHLFAAYEWSKYVPEGYSVEVVPMANSNDEKDALLSGDVDFALMGVPTVISQASQDGGIKVIAGGADGGSGLMVSSSITTVDQLKGKKIGYVPNSSQEMALRLLLKSAGLNPDSDVQMINIGYSEMSEALARGDIDAFAGAEMGVSLAKLAGANEIDSIYNTQIGKVNIALAASDKVISGNPDLVKIAIAAHKKSTEALSADKAAWKDGVMKQFTFDSDALDKALDNMWLHWDLNDEYQKQCEELAKQMVDIGSIQTAPESSAYLDDQFVK